MRVEIVDTCELVAVVPGPAVPEPAVPSGDPPLDLDQVIRWLSQLDDLDLDQLVRLIQLTRLLDHGKAALRDGWNCHNRRPASNLEPDREKRA